LLTDAFLGFARGEQVQTNAKEWMPAAGVALQNASKGHACGIASLKNSEFLLMMVRLSLNHWALGSLL
jgi:hypothetical protein